MTKAYPQEKRNQILSRILSKEITIAQAHREYGVALSCLHRWLNELKSTATSASKPKVQAIPLPRGMNLRSAILAAGYCCEVGLDSAATGKYCRAKGITLEEIKAFCAWLETRSDDAVMADDAKTRERELITKVSELNEDNKSKARELNRKEKALAETAALLVLSKKAQAIWGDKEK